MEGDPSVWFLRPVAVYSILGTSDRPFRWCWRRTHARFASIATKEVHDAKYTK